MSSAPSQEDRDSGEASRHLFRSVHHPGNRPVASVYSRALARPTGACVIPVMIGAATVVLMGRPAWGFLVYGLPGALIVATAWTHFTLRRRFAELHLRPGEAAVRSVHDILIGRKPEWHPLHGIQAGRWDVKLSVGWRSYVFRAPEWPSYAQLRSVAEEAAEGGTSATPPSP